MVEVESGIVQGVYGTRMGEHLQARMLKAVGIVLEQCRTDLEIDELYCSSCKIPISIVPYGERIHIS